MVKIYEVGGCVRDRLLGLESKDIDYAVEANSWEEMRDYIKERGKIYLEKPEYHTIRAKMPELGDADFVLCRKDGEYTDGRRPDTVEPGTIYDDLARRDFTMNAIAIDVETGKVLDPYNGRSDIKTKFIKAVGNANTRIREDSLRMLRALRFAVTKNMDISGAIQVILFNDYSLLKNVSEDRIREELHKMFMYSTVRTLRLLEDYPGLRTYIFTNFNIRLVPKSYVPKGKK